MGNVESQEMDNVSPELGTIEHSRTRRRRRHLQGTRHEIPANNSATSEGSWWSDIEHENLIMDQVTAESSLTDFVKCEDHVDCSNGSLKNLMNTRFSLTIEKNIDITDQSNNYIEREIKGCTDAVAYVAECGQTKDIQIADNLKENFPDENGSRPRPDFASREQSLDEFKEELQRKRVARLSAVQNLRDEIVTLRKQLSSEQALNHRLRQKYEVDNTANATDRPCQLFDDEEDEANGACALDADDNDAMSRGRHANIELANAQLALQLANSENISLRAELCVLQKQVGTLKEVVSCCKQMLSVKEEQCNELKAKLTEIETSFAEREMKIMSENLRHEYERQLGNIRQLRELYEERQRISAAEHENLQRLISIKKDELLAEQEKTKSFEERNQTLIKEVESANKELATLREECNEHKFEKKTLKEEMGAVNTLFSQMVMGFNGKNNLDIDRLTTMLEENRSLLNDMATKEVSCADGATLPKLLFELVEQATLSSCSPSPRCGTPTALDVDKPTDTDEAVFEKKDRIGEENSSDNQNENATVQSYAMNSVDSIGAADCATVNCFTDAASSQANFENNHDSNVIPKKQHRRNSNTKSKLPHTTSLPTLSSIYFTPAARQKLHEPEVIGKVVSTQEIIGNLPKVWKVLMELLSHHNIERVRFEETGNSEDCYKSVDTPNGPKAELSVSKTYIKLKDLILEKKSLVKETNRLKTLNSHLECRLNAQEKRLSAVSLELSKTWHLVGKMQRQHRQLHTQEQILRYQLQQKRRLLSELKEELEYCRRKWAAARAKNDESQEQCNDLRREFAKRKLEDANNSAESGYSDSGPPSDDEERAAAFGGVNSCRKHLREMFEHTRKIKRMQSTSPGRAAAYAVADGTVASEEDAAVNGGNSSMLVQQPVIVLRWNSAPPTCGWRRRRRREDNEEEGEDDDDDDDDGNGDEDRNGNGEADLPPRLFVVSRATGGAIPKQNVKNMTSSMNVERENEASVATTGRASRIQRLEEQCKSLIQQVLETSDNRERLEVQLCRFQDEIAPAQYAVPLDEFINKRRNERMSRASSAPAAGSLTAREEEYTRKRSERLGRLEEESRQLMSRIKRTSDRGHYLRCSLDRIRRVPSREASYDSAPEEDVKKDNNVSGAAEACERSPCEKSPLSAEEEAYTARRASRLNRLEEEGRQLLGVLSRNAQRGNTMGNKLDSLRERYGNNEEHINDGLSTAQRLEDIHQVTVNRDERLRLLEQESLELIARLSSTSARGTRMINRIAERAERREGRMNATAESDLAKAYTVPAAGENSAAAEETAATALLPTAANVACSSIVSDEVAECVTVTTIPSQLATRELGAIPKSKPAAQLCAARHKSERFTSETKVNDDSGTCSGVESLEQMVKRLRDTPYPEGRNTMECKSNAVADENELENEPKSDGNEQEE